MILDQAPEQPAKGADWHAWCKTADGFYILIQIAGQAGEERAKDIMQQIVEKIT